MVGYTTLKNDSFVNILKKNQAIHKALIKTIQDDFGSTIEYIIEDDKCIILTPIKVKYYAQNLANIRKRENNNYTFIAPMVGQGITEGHIVTAFCQKELPNTVTLFDSKASNLERFIIGKSFKPPFFETLVRLFYPKSTSYTYHDEDTNATLEFEHITLGTQSFFDDVSCGFHTAANMMACWHIALSNTTPSKDMLLNSTNSPVTQGALALENKTPHNTKLIDFIKNAWHETFLPLHNLQQRKQINWFESFVEWPTLESKGKKIFYFLTLSFLFKPLSNLVKLITEYPLNILSELSNYVKNKIIAWTPTSSKSQFLRSGLLSIAMGLQLLFKLACYTIRPITSPITSFREAYKFNKALGLLSAALSISIYLAFIELTGPLLWSLIVKYATPVIINTLEEALSALAFPVASVMQLVGIHLSALTEALTTITTLFGLRSLLSHGIEAVGSNSDKPLTKKTPVEKKSNTTEEEESNTNKEEDGFAIIPDDPHYNSPLSGSNVPNQPDSKEDKERSTSYPPHGTP